MRMRQKQGVCISISFYQSLIALLVDTHTEGADYLSGEKAVPVHMYAFARCQSLKDHRGSHSRRASIVLSYGSIEKDSCVPS